MRRLWFVVIVVLIVAPCAWAQEYTMGSGEVIYAQITGISDADGDQVWVEANWSLDVDGVITALPEYSGESAPQGPPYEQPVTSTIPQGITKKGEIWRLLVRACDDDGCSGWAAIRIDITGSVPSVPTVIIVEGAPPPPF